MLYEIFLSFLNLSRNADSGAKWSTLICFLKKSVSFFRYNQSSLWRSSENVDGDRNCRGVGDGVVSDNDDDDECDDGDEDNHSVCGDDGNDKWNADVDDDGNDDYYDDDDGHGGH